MMPKNVWINPYKRAVTIVAIFTAVAIHAALLHHGFIEPERELFRGKEIIAGSSLVCAGTLVLLVVIEFVCLVVYLGTKLYVKMIDWDIRHEEAKKTMKQAIGVGYDES